MKRRDEALSDIAGRSFDVCVIGGGATGSGCALDSQLRGMKTVLLDGSDFGSGASTAATKIVVIRSNRRYPPESKSRIAASVVTAAQTCS